MAEWWEAAPLADQKDAGDWWKSAPMADAKEQPKGKPTALQSAGRGAMQGATFGFADEMSGAAAAMPGMDKRQANADALGMPAIPSPVDMAIGGGRSILEMLAPSLFGTKGGEAYAQGRDESRALNDAARAANPKSYMAGEIGGGVGVGLGAMGAGATLMRPGMSLPALVGVGGVEGAGYGALSGAGNATTDTAGDALEGAKTGALIGSAVPVAARAIGSIISRAITPLPVAPERQAMIDVLAKEGVPMTAGQRSGSKALQYAESYLGDAPFAGGKATQAMNDQAEAFTNALMGRIGGSGRATPENMSANYGRIGKSFEDLSARNVLRSDPQLGNDLGKVMTEYDKVLPSEQRALVGNQVSDIVDRITRGGGSMPGAEYQTARSRLSRSAQNARMGDPEYSDALRGIRDSIDSAMGRSISPQDAAAWAEARKQYGNYKTLEKAVGGAGSGAAEGLVSPQAVRSAVASGANKGQYVRGQGDFAELARAGNSIMSPLPNSGTAQRAMTGGLTGSAGALFATGRPISAAATMLGPGLAGRGLMWEPVQNYLSNQAVSPKSQAALEAYFRAMLLGGGETQSDTLRLR